MILPRKPFAAHAERAVWHDLAVVRRTVSVTEQVVIEPPGIGTAVFIVFGHRPQLVIAVDIRFGSTEIGLGRFAGSGAVIVLRGLFCRRRHIPAVADSVIAALCVAELRLLGLRRRFVRSYPPGLIGCLVQVLHGSVAVDHAAVRGRLLALHAASICLGIAGALRCGFAFAVGKTAQIIALVRNGVIEIGIFVENAVAPVTLGGKFVVVEQYLSAELRRGKPVVILMRRLRLHMLSRKVRLPGRLLRICLPLGLPVCRGRLFVCRLRRHRVRIASGLHRII